MKKSVFASLVTLLMVAFAADANAQALKLEKGDHICLVGNALGERMQHHNYWETLLHQNFADQQLVVRNLCFPGDEAFTRIRSENFGEPDVHLTHSGASVVMYFFGFNESFAGEEGLESFTADMKRLVNETKTKDYSGKGAPRIVLVSPIAFENTGDANLPDGDAENENLLKYTSALRDVASETEVGFVDLFSPTRAMFEKSDERLTLNGAHLNDEGYRQLAPVLMFGLFGTLEEAELDVVVKAEIDDKNFHWWHRYRAVNGFSIYGKRGEAGSDGTYRNREVMERERAILDQMAANRDARIWALASGEAVAAVVDDSNTLAFIEPKTNVGGEDDPNRARGKLGSLDYLSAEEQQKLFTLPDGYEVQLVATEEDFPELANPVALNFDSRGRLWVSTMPSYPHWKPKTEMGDKLLILEDHDGDGRADECKVFADGLHQPTGFELGHGGAFVAQQPDILFLEDVDGDDKADVRIRKLVGFDSADTHHGLAAFEWGPDGALYFQEGTFKFSQVESPYGLTRMAEAGVWRYDPRTEQFGSYVSFSFANPWGHVFDRWGQSFLADASPGFNYWATPISGHVEFPAKHPGGAQHRRVSSLAGGDPQYQFPRFLKKRTRPSSGCEFIVTSHFPPEAQGNFLVNNVIGDLCILQHTVKEDGSGFGGEEVEKLIECTDGNFRPVDLQIGPDGALYIVDWHNALIGHLQHNLREPNRDHSHGRIWRVVYKDRPLLDPPNLEELAINELLELLKTNEDRLRYRVRRELSARDSGEVESALQAWTNSLEKDDENYEHHLLEALWAYQTHNVVNKGLLERMLGADDGRARAAAVRVLCYWRDRIEGSAEMVKKSLADPHPRVRLEAVRACSFYPAEEMLEAALEVLNHETDVWIEYTLEETLKTLESQ